MGYKINSTGLKIFICGCLLLPIFLMGSAAQGEDAKKEIQQKDFWVNNAVNELKRAIKTRDFSKLRYDIPTQKPLSWSSCDRNSEIRLSFDAMINKLSAISKNSDIIINETPVRIYVTTIETKAWNGERPYLYFEFKRVSYGWRWLGVYDCATQSSDFRNASKGDFADPRGDVKLQRLISRVKQAIQSKDFKLLRPYVPDKRTYYWRYGCADGDMPSDELSFEAITEILLRKSKGVEIYFNPKPEIDWNFENMSIETEGWLGEYPFLTFSFFLLNDRLIWGGACYSATPELKRAEKGRYEPTHFRTPQLPRPGPRTFRDDSALKARIEEIVKFRAFDALEPYAINKILIFEKCSKAVMDSGRGEYWRLKGKKRPAREVIEFLKKTAHDAKEIKFSGAGHMSYYETLGWKGEYPFIAFWIAEGKSGWELTGVTYCKTSVMEVLFPGQIRRKY